MKNIKTNAMLLSLGLLVSFSVMHADVTQQAQELKNLITDTEKDLLNDLSVLSSLNSEKLHSTKAVDGMHLARWNRLMQTSIFPFIQKEANNFPASAKLKAALETVKNVKNFHLNPDSTIKQNDPTTKNELLKSVEALITHIKALKSETFPFSAGKRAAKDLADHLMNSLGQISAHIIKFITLEERVDKGQTNKMKEGIGELNKPLEKGQSSIKPSLAKPAKNLSNEELKNYLYQRLQEYRKLHLEGLENASHLTDTSNATINDLNPGDRQNLNDKYASIKSQVDSLTQNATEEQKTLIQDFWSRLNRLHFPNRPAFKAWK